MIQLSELTKSFGDRVLLDHVTWQITDGECVGLCGPNGAGKTTLLKMMAGLDEPDSGAVLKPAGLSVGYLPQDGLTVIREAKRYKADLPVIIITGFSTESSAIEAVNLGVAGYLTKPFRVPQVLAAAAKALGE